MMQDVKVVWDGAEMHLPRDPMRSLSPSAELDPAISISVGVARPDPTGSKFGKASRNWTLLVDVEPESDRNWSRWSSDGLSGSGHGQNIGRPFSLLKVVNQMLSDVHALVFSAVNER